mmetsp:Transcript_19540/g.49046  ORF Transcript_19540/g.49046 Transcript_19540/m.49046 type:complete len:218 (-) Transcript_19540:816-1469(-)
MYGIFSVKMNLVGSAFWSSVSTSVNKYSTLLQQADSVRMSLAAYILSADDRWYFFTQSFRSANGAFSPLEDTVPGRISNRSSCRVLSRSLISASEQSASRVPTSGFSSFRDARNGSSSSSQSMLTAELWCSTGALLVLNRSSRFCRRSRAAASSPQPPSQNESWLSTEGRLYTSSSFREPSMMFGLFCQRSFNCPTYLPGGTPMMSFILFAATPCSL